MKITLNQFRNILIENETILFSISNTWHFRMGETF